MPGGHVLKRLTPAQKRLQTASQAAARALLAASNMRAGRAAGGRASAAKRAAVAGPAWIEKCIAKCQAGPRKLSASKLKKAQERAAVNPWLAHVAEFRKIQPQNGMSSADYFALAKLSYKPKK